MTTATQIGSMVSLWRYLVKYSYDPGILRAAAQHNQVNVGVYATVQQGGRICRGDSIKLL